MPPITIRRLAGAAATAVAALGLTSAATDVAAQVPGAVTPAPEATPAPAAAAPSAPAPAVARPGVELKPGVSFEVTELRRMTDKGVMQLKFTVSNQTEYDTTLKDLGLAHSHQLKDISVIDFAGRKEYDFGNAGGCLCSTFSDSSGGMIAAGQSREFWAWYGLPQGSNKRMAIRIPDYQPIMDVPLQ